MGLLKTGLRLATGVLVIVGVFWVGGYSLSRLHDEVVLQDVPTTFQPAIVKLPQLSNSIGDYYNPKAEEDVVDDIVAEKPYSELSSSKVVIVNNKEFLYNNATSVLLNTSNENYIIQDRSGENLQYHQNMENLSLLISTVQIKDDIDMTNNDTNIISLESAMTRGADSWSDEKKEELINSPLNIKQSGKINNYSKLIVCSYYDLAMSREEISTIQTNERFIGGRLKK